MSEPRLVVLEAAFHDILEQGNYFNSKSGSLLAQKWGAAVQASIQSLKVMPLRGSSIEFTSLHVQHVRRIPVGGFERHVILYSLDFDESVLTVLAVLHTSRDIAALLTLPRT